MPVKFEGYREPSVNEFKPFHHNYTNGRYKKLILFWSNNNKTLEDERFFAAKKRILFILVWHSFINDIKKTDGLLEHIESLLPAFYNYFKTYLEVLRVEVFNRKQMYWLQAEFYKFLKQNFPDWLDKIGELSPRHDEKIRNRKLEADNQILAVYSSAKDSFLSESDAVLLENIKGLDVLWRLKIHLFGIIKEKYKKAIKFSNEGANVWPEDEAVEAVEEIEKVAITRVVEIAKAFSDAASVFSSEIRKKRDFKEIEALGALQLLKYTLFNGVKQGFEEGTELSNEGVKVCSKANAVEKIKEVAITRVRNMATAFSYFADYYHRCQPLREAGILNEGELKNEAKSHLEDIEGKIDENDLRGLKEGCKNAISEYENTVAERTVYKTNKKILESLAVKILDNDFPEVWAGVSDDERPGLIRNAVSRISGSLPITECENGVSLDDAYLKLLQIIITNVLQEKLQRYTIPSSTKGVDTEKPSGVEPASKRRRKDGLEESACGLEESACLLNMMLYIGQQLRDKDIYCVGLKVYLSRDKILGDCWQACGKNIFGNLNVDQNSTNLIKLGDDVGKQLLGLLQGDLHPRMKDLHLSHKGGPLTISLPESRLNLQEPEVAEIAAKNFEDQFKECLMQNLDDLTIIAFAKEMDVASFSAFCNSFYGYRKRSPADDSGAVGCVMSALLGVYSTTLKLLELSEFAKIAYLYYFAHFVEGYTKLAGGEDFQAIQTLGKSCSLFAEAHKTINYQQTKKHDGVVGAPKPVLVR